MNRVAAAVLNIVVGRGVCGAAVEVDPGPRRTQQVMTYTAWAVLVLSTGHFLHACGDDICHALSNHFIGPFQMKLYFPILFLRLPLLAIIFII